nr:hypothetical protein [Tanacetum cinerariifolium]
PTKLHQEVSDIDANKDIYLVNVHRDEDIFGVNDQDDTPMFDADKDLQGEKVVVEEVNVASITTATTTIAATTPTISMDEITLANALIEIKHQGLGERDLLCKSQTVEESSSKRAGDELEQESSMKQKIEDENESAELKRCLKIVLDDGDEVTIDATPLFSKSLTIVDYKMKEGKKRFF